MDTLEIKDLKLRYLLWFYKTTKEAVDKVERKFTQLEVDRTILAELKRSDRHKQMGSFVGEFEKYIFNKQKDARNAKYDGREVRPAHRFLILKLKAIEKAIIKAAGRRGLAEIKSLYEREMRERILKSTEQR